MKYYIILIFSVISLYSCEKTINLKIEDKGRKIVVNSIAYADSTLKVNLSESKYILSSYYEIIPVSDAEISLFENETEIEKISQGIYGIFEFSYFLKEGKQYIISVNSSKFGTSVAKTNIPSKTHINKIDYEVKESNNNGYTNIDGVDFKLQFKDNISETNFYWVQVYYTDTYEYIDYQTDDTIRNTYTNYLSLNTYDPSTAAIYLSKPGLLFNDELFNGEEYTLSFYIDYLYFGFSEDGNNVKTTYYFTLVNISEELYNYYISYSKYRESDGNPFAEPVKVFNNIENGFGIFGGSNVAIDSVLIEYQFNY